MKRIWSVVLLAAVCFGIVLFTSCEKSSDLITAGDITEDTEWEGEITLTGDILVHEGVTLTIMPGTMINVSAGRDDTRLSHLGEVDDLTTGDPTEDPGAGGTEFQQSRISIIVNGDIICRGTENQPIIFKSTSTDPYYTDWSGITAKNAVFEYTIVEWCINGIYSLEGSEYFTVDHCIVRHTWAAGIGLHRPAPGAPTAIVKHCTIEDCGHEAIDTHNPGSIEMAYNLIKDSQVGFNLHDEMQANIHHNIVVNTTFPVLCVNTPDVFVTHCTMQAAIQNNSRWTYDGWTMPQLQDPAVFFATNNSSTSVIFTNSILFDSPVGIRNEASENALVNGYLNMDNISQPFLFSALQGAGILELSSGFVDKENGDYHLSASSPLLHAGNPADGNPELGAYGGTNAEDVIGCAL